MTDELISLLRDLKQILIKATERLGWIAWFLVCLTLAVLAVAFKGGSF